MRKTIILVMATFLFLLSGLRCSLAQVENAGTLSRWIDGPVRYLITYKEEKAFKKLRTESQRAYFIYRFWFKRDPSPGTVRNEYREIFWDRVITANTMFNESSTPGWRSDRGKIFILFGPPDMIESDIHPSVPFPPPGPSRIRGQKRSITEPDGTQRIIEGPSPSSSLNVDSGFRGIERWIYSRSKGKDISANLIIAFYMSAAGEYKLSENPQHYSNLFPGLEATADISSRFGFVKEPPGSSDIRTDILFSKAIDYIPPFSFENSMAFKLDLAEAIVTPTVEDLIDETVNTSQFFNKLNALFKAYYFLDESRNTYVVLQGMISKKDILKEENHEPALVSIFGRLEKEDRKNEFYSFSSDALIPGTIIEDGENLILLANVTIPPGKYRTRIGILNLPYGEAGNSEIMLDVPDLSLERPGLSSLVLASSIEYHEGSSGEFSSDIFINPKAYPEFNRDHDFGIYYIVYNLEKNAQTGLADFAAEYRFFRREGGEYKRIGSAVIKRNLQREVQGWTFPLRTWPVGDFMLEIGITDNISGRATSKSIEFSVR